MTQALTVNGRKIPAGITRYETQINGQPVYGGANDPRMGDLHNKSDPGHFGHIDLARPVYHQGFITVVLKTLRCVCYHCSRITVEETEFKFQRNLRILNRKRRLNAMHEYLRTRKKCEHCNGHQPKYTKVGLHLEAEFSDEMDSIPGGGDRKQFLPAAKTVEIFSRMREEDMKALGLDVTWARPEWLCISVMPVPPIHPPVVPFRPVSCY